MKKVYDKVWIMENNAPKEKLIFAVIESMDFGKQGTEITYRLVDSSVGAGWGNNEGIGCSEENMFDSKEDLLNSL